MSTTMPVKLAQSEFSNRTKEFLRERDGFTIGSILQEAGLAYRDDTIEWDLFKEILNWTDGLSLTCVVHFEDEPTLPEPVKVGDFLKDFFDSQDEEEGMAFHADCFTTARLNDDGVIEFRDRDKPVGADLRIAQFIGALNQARIDAGLEQVVTLSIIRR